ncbi:MAG: sensor histidine kinase [Pseudomonadota bacterium]
MGSGRFSLSRWFAVVGLLSIAALGVVAALLLSRLFADRMLRQEGVLTREFVQSVVLVEKAGTYFLDRGEGRATELEDAFDHIARMPDVLRANVHSLERVVIWSSDRAIIGRRFGDNPELDEALAGELVVHLGDTRAGVRPKSELAGLDRDAGPFVELYLPIRDEQGGRVIGVVELYKTPRALFEAIRLGQRSIWIGAAAGGLFLYLVLFGIVRRADNLIRVQQERLVESETLAAVGEMGSAVAHGIRNPLAAIRSSAELLLDADTESSREAAADIVAEADRLESWVRELLSFARPLSGKREPIRLDALVRAEVAAVRRETDRRGIAVTAEVRGPVPAVSADPLLIGQVLNSLLANAIEAIGHNGHIQVGVARQAGGQVAVSIRDDGPGMTEEQKKRLFKPFHTTKAKGLGIGLALAKRIIERFGGRIVVASEPGRGTRVDFTLPAAD